ncbi:MAG: hypothetical protein ACIAXF_14395 [Phycisphaerales bacterium JB063]
MLYLHIAITVFMLLLMGCASTTTPDGRAFVAGPTLTVYALPGEDRLDHLVFVRNGRQLTIQAPDMLLQPTSAEIGRWGNKDIALVAGRVGWGTGYSRHALTIWHLTDGRAVHIGNLPTHTYSITPNGSEHETTIRYIHTHTQEQDSSNTVSLLLMRVAVDGSDIGQQADSEYTVSSQLVQLINLPATVSEAIIEIEQTLVGNPDSR